MTEPPINLQEVNEKLAEIDAGLLLQAKTYGVEKLFTSYQANWGKDEDAARRNLVDHAVSRACMLWLKDQLEKHNA